MFCTSPCALKALKTERQSPVTIMESDASMLWECASWEGILPSGGLLSIMHVKPIDTHFRSSFFFPDSVFY